MTSYKIRAKYCPNCDGDSSLVKFGRTLTHFKCDDCGTKWSRHSSDLYFHTKNELRLNPAKFVARSTFGKNKRK
jgi:transposase-like protein